MNGAFDREDTSENSNLITCYRVRRLSQNSDLSEARKHHFLAFDGLKIRTQVPKNTVINRHLLNKLPKLHP